MSSSVVEIENYSKKSVLLKLLDIEYKTAWGKKLTNFEAEWNRSDTKPGWIISKKYEEELLNLLKESKRSRKPRQEKDKHSRIKKQSNDKEESESSHSEESERSGSEDESDEDSSDDELIQMTLTRKLKYESSQKCIEEDNIENSDLEDVVSMCRRIRYLLKVNRQLSERIRELENRNK
jgi:uncharacterized protein with von Willebrand factor type A (vWA) domain